MILMIHKKPSYPLGTYIRDGAHCPLSNPLQFAQENSLQISSGKTEMEFKVSEISGQHIFSSLTENYQDR